MCVIQVNKVGLRPTTYYTLTYIYIYIYGFGDFLFEELKIFLVVGMFDVYGRVSERMDRECLEILNNGGNCGRQNGT